MWLRGVGGGAGGANTEVMALRFCRIDMLLCDKMQLRPVSCRPVSCRTGGRVDLGTTEEGGWVFDGQLGDYRRGFSLLPGCQCMVGHREMQRLVLSATRAVVF